jgi:uncharacterized C2H2 Zn-finger protein
MKQCPNCGRWFKNKQSLGSHKRHCLGEIGENGKNKEIKKRQATDIH